MRLVVAEEIEQLRLKVHQLTLALTEAKKLGISACEMAMDAAGVLADFGTDPDGEWRNTRIVAYNIRTALESLNE